MALGLLAFFYALMPALLIYACMRFPALNKVGAVLLAYLTGILLSFSGLLPEQSDLVQKWGTELTVPIALPLLLFSLDVKKWFQLAGKAFVSFLAALAGLIAIVIFGHWLLADKIDEAWKVAGLLIGVYTGGTPNLAAIKTALDVNNETYIITHTFDSVYSLLYILFFISIGQKMLLKILPAFSSNQTSDVSNTTENVEDINDYRGILTSRYIPGLLKAFLFSVLILAFGGGASMLVPEEYSTALAILLITTSGILLSLVPSVKRIEKTFHLGMYFILVFSIIVASMIDLRQLANTSPALLLYIGMAVFGSLTLHIIMARVFKVDADTTIITSTAMICSPPFVPVVAGALKNKEVILSGLTIGIIGYAIGNYIGIAVAYLLK